MATSSAAARSVPWVDRTAVNPPITLNTLLREFEVGAAYQRALLPKLPAVQGYDLFSFHRAAHLLSGDYFDCFPLSKGRVGLLVSDASGKGISGALIAQAFRSVVRNLPRDRYEKPAAFMRIANQLLLRTIKRGVFVSAVYGVLDPARHEITVSNAGHLPMLVHHAQTNKVIGYTNHAPVLGVLSAKQFEAKIAESTLRLSPRDRLMLFTDGVNEAKAPSQLDFGLGHLHARMTRDRLRPSQEMVRNIVDEVDVHRSGWEQSDDITIIAAQRLG
jgi:sigma-B regulation protein RsbU (phosphoserine phosphatase)